MDSGTVALKSWVGATAGSFQDQCEGDLDMAISPISHMSLNLGPQVGEDDAIVRVRVVPIGSDGHTVYARTLNFGEADNGEFITVEPGDTLIFPAGTMKVTIADVDRYSEQTPDGYAPVANTVWSWLAIPPRAPLLTVHNYMLAAARRLDIAHVHCMGALSGLAACSSQASFLKTRAVMFEALGHAESMCIALSRAVRMLRQAKGKVSVKIAVPVAVDTVESRVRSIRDAFEHIDERAEGKAMREGPADAMSVFDQNDFFTSGILRYAERSLDIAGEAVPAMVASRQFIIDAVSAEGPTKTLQKEMKWTFTADPDPFPIVSADEAK